MSGAAARRSHARRTICRLDRKCSAGTGAQPWQKPLFSLDRAPTRKARSSVDTRIKSQSGASLLFGREATLPEYGRDGISIACLTIRNKAHILRQLDSIKIHATTVYPGIDKTAKRLRDQYCVAADA